MVMMPVSTAALNQLPKRLIAHGAAMDNTMKMIAASVGTAILVTVMTSATENAQQRPEIVHPDMYGAQISFIVIAVLSLIRLPHFFQNKGSKISRKRVRGEELNM